jgi:hypothetical protein
MRPHHAVAVVVALVIGLGLKTFFYPSRPVGAHVQAPASASMDVFLALLAYSAAGTKSVFCDRHHIVTGASTLSLRLINRCALNFGGESNRC